ncbi:WD40-repeat-containing domain protein [Paraphysoderma sedebokerense]|nr:WD40-repeat-containing domain protein [Paraphysoderma sedebokerense]
MKTSAPRTSDLQAPIMQLTGHEGEVFSAKFSPTGEHIASGSFDRNIFLWNVYGDCKNWCVLNGHANAVLEVQWSRDSKIVYSASADKSLGIWDVETATRLKKCKGHTSIVNSCCPNRRGPELLLSGGDDGFLNIWDARQKNPVDTMESGYPITAVSFSEAGDVVFSGGIDNDITAWDLRKQEPIYKLYGHNDTIAGMRLSHDGNYLLSNSMDNTVKIWDVKPFAVADRCLKSFEGAPHDYSKQLIRPCWSPSGRYVACGSADRSVVVWDTVNRQILYKLPGHKGVVTEVDWHPKEAVIVSSSMDRTMFLGELEVDEL